MSALKKKSSQAPTHFFLVTETRAPCLPQRLHNEHSELLKTHPITGRLTVLFWCFMLWSQQTVGTGRTLRNKAAHKRCAANPQLLRSHSIPRLPCTDSCSPRFQREGEGRGTVTATSSYFSSIYFCQIIQQKRMLLDSTFSVFRNFSPPNKFKSGISHRFKIRQW